VAVAAARDASRRGRHPVPAAAVLAPDHVTWHVGHLGSLTVQDK
jgi:hypothetical protein